MKPTKYIRRLPDGKGGWKYIYPGDGAVKNKKPQKGTFSSYPTTDDPGKLERKDFISSEDYLKQIRNKYLSSNENHLKEDIGLKVGQWKIDHFPGMRGNKIYQLRKIDFDDIENSNDIINEINSIDKEDSDKYLSLIKNGKTPPPIEVEETLSGKLKIVDGKKLARELLVSGREIFAWVLPLSEMPTMMESKDKPIKTELTYQIAKQKAQADNSKRTVNENILLDYYLEKDISIEDLIGKRIVGYRYGKAPDSGKSFNSMTNTFENGVSIAKIGNMEEIKSFAVLGIKERGAKKYYYEGEISGEGGDDEITMKNVKEISYLDYKKKLKNKEIIENSNNIAAAFAQRKISLYNRGWSGSNPEEIKTWLLKNISKQSNTLEKARRDNPGVFTAYTPRQLRDAIEIEMKECNDIKKASDTAMRNLRMNPNHYDIQSGGMTRDKLADAINKLKGAL